MLRGWRTGLVALVGLAAGMVPGGTRGDDAADRRALVGVWEGYIAEPRTERPNLRFSEIVITPERIRGKRGDGSDMGEGTYRLGAEGQRRTLDAFGLAGEPQGKTYLGIYEFRGETLRWCMCNPGKPRPQEFASRPGAQQFLVILTRKRQ